MKRPTLSIIVPAHRSAEALGRCLEALVQSEGAPRDSEIIVVDDSSGDETPDVAGRFTQRVIRLEGGPGGPAYARNRGAEAAEGEFLAFVDADVCVHPGTLEGFVSVLRANPDVGAVFGAYDDRPPATGFVSQYRNLLHHYVHSIHSGEASTFWAGCGAVRRAAFFQCGGFDQERYRRPQIEDIELGHRLRDAGWRILLRPEHQGTHLKRWTLRGGIRTDVWDRGIPWARLLVEDRLGMRGAGGDPGRHTALNLGNSEKALTVLMGVGLLAAVIALVTGGVEWLLVTGVATVGVVVANAPLLKWFMERRGLAFATAVVPLRILYYSLNAGCVVWVGAELLARGAPRSGSWRLGGSVHASSDETEGDHGSKWSSAGRTHGDPEPVPDPERQSAPSPPEAVVERELALAFAPLHKLALGVGVGVTAALLLFAVTIVAISIGAHDSDLFLLSQYFVGYGPTLGGALKGAGWAFFVGSVSGWFAAFVRNLVVAVWIFIVRARADFSAHRDFLDHI